MAIKRCLWQAETLDRGTDLYRQMAEIFALREMVARFDNASLSVTDSDIPRRHLRPVCKSGAAPPAHARHTKSKKTIG